MTTQNSSRIEAISARMTRPNIAAVSGQLRRPVAAAVAAWILSMIALPIARWMWGDAVIPAFSTFSVIMQCAAVTLILREGWGNRRALRTFAIVAILTWGAEWLGSTTGFPFGHYQYTESLQPQISGVPLLIPLAWLMMLGPSWAIAYAVLGSSLDGMKRLIALSTVTAAAMTAWDLYLDPQMVGWGFWVWEISGEYFGIPLVNFAGWFAVAFLVTLVARPLPVPLRPLLVIYGVVWIFQAIGMAVFWGQPGPALFGFVGMGLMLALALWRGGRSLWMP